MLIMIWTWSDKKITLEYPTPGFALEKKRLLCGKLMAICHGISHTPSIAFRHLPPNSAKFSYATEGALFYLRAAVHRRGQRPPKSSGTDKTVEAT